LIQEHLHPLDQILETSLRKFKKQQMEHQVLLKETWTIIKVWSNKRTDLQLLTIANKSSLKTVEHISKISEVWKTQLFQIYTFTQKTVSAQWLKMLKMNSWKAQPQGQANYLWPNNSLKSKRENTRKDMTRNQSVLLKRIHCEEKTKWKWFNS